MAKRAAKPRKPSMPDEVIITLEEDGPDSHFLAAHREVDHLDSGQVVGIYELKDIYTVKRTTELEKA